MRGLLACALLVLASCDLFSGPGADIALAFKQGDQYRYTLTFHMLVDVRSGTTSRRIESEVAGTETATVMSVASDGVADLSLRVVDRETGAIHTQELTVAPDGRILAISGDGIASQSPFGVLVGTSLAYAVLPDSTVHPGDTFKKKYDLAQLGGQSNVHMSVDGEYVNRKSLLGPNDAWVETVTNDNFTTTIGGASMEALVTLDTQSLIDVSTRRMVETVIGDTTGPDADFTATIHDPEGDVTVAGSESLRLEAA